MVFIPFPNISDSCCETYVRIHAINELFCNFLLLMRDSLKILWSICSKLHNFDGFNTNGTKLRNKIANSKTKFCSRTRSQIYHSQIYRKRNVKYYFASNSLSWAAAPSKLQKCFQDLHAIC